MSTNWDVAVIGAGHNGLAAATLLARAGRKVVVLERRERVGGLAASDEFAPGYHSGGVLQDTSLVRRWAVERLGLGRFGLELRGEPLPTLIAEEEGSGYLHWRDPERAAAETGDQAVARSYREMRVFLGRLEPIFRSVFDHPPADLEGLSPGDFWDLGRKALALRLLGRRDMMELLRVVPMCAGDWLRELFDSEILCAALAVGAVTQGYTGPWSPWTTLGLLLGESLAHDGVEGGPGALVKALEQAAADAGVEVRTAAAVRELAFDRGRVSGVLLEGGEEMSARAVAAACDPKTLFLDLVPPLRLPMDLERDLVRYRARGTAAKVNLALSAYPELSCRPGLVAARVRTGATLDRLEKAFDPVKYRQMPEEPVLEIEFPTVESPELAPAGHHVASIFAHWVPYDLEGGWSDARREELYERVLEGLERVAPGVRKSVVGRQVLAPPELESVYGVKGGNLLHGEHAPDQLLNRPAPGCARYATPLPGLYLCGSGSHPGGGLTCAPGTLAAEAILGAAR